MDWVLFLGCFLFFIAVAVLEKGSGRRCGKIGKWV